MRILGFMRNGPLHVRPGVRRLPYEETGFIQIVPPETDKVSFLPERSMASGHTYERFKGHSKQYTAKPRSEG